MSDTPRTDAANDKTMRYSNRFERVLELCRELERDLALSQAPVIGECEDCGHKIVTPLKRLLPQRSPQE